MLSDAAEPLPSQIFEVLEAERRAIRSLDLDGLESLVARKEALFAKLAQSGASRGELEEIAQRARHNCLLLAHARDLTRSVVASLTPGAAPPVARGLGPRPQRTGVRLSVTG